MTHNAKVKRLVADFKRAKGSVSLAKKTSHLFRPLEKTAHRLQVEDFCDVLSVKDGVVDVEGMASIEQTVTETLKYGYMPRVSMELKHITVGGATCGVGIESSSFKYGLFHQNVTEMEILTPKGEVIVCTPTKNSDLFYGIPNSYGTLGYILRLKIKLKKVKKYVHLEYLHYNRQDKFLTDYKELSDSKQKHDFIEGLVYSPKSFVVSIGTFVDEAPYSNDYTHMKSYYKSVEERNEDYLETGHFIFRWDPDWFWGSKGNIFGFAPFRLIFGKWLLNSANYMKYLRLEQKYKIREKFPMIWPDKLESLIQDILIPKENLSEYLKFLITKIQIFPIWLCAVDAVPSFKLFPTKKNMYVDFGFWSARPLKASDPGYWNKLVESKTREEKGVKSLYSDVFYEEKDFWKNTDKAYYDKLKAKYDPDHRLKNLYEKTITR
ncbi:MAG TPA: FAD-binding protein [Patescibacteria group bacterium]|nr:FAD-binding protein [Patescibacteria group bacterium]